MKFLFLCGLLCFSAVALAKDHPIETAMVVSQEISSSQNGAAVMPLNGMLIGVPLTRRSNIVVIETPHHRVTLTEQMTGRGPLILSVHEPVQFYRDGRWVVVLDMNGKKHKFGILHIEALDKPLP